MERTPRRAADPANPDTIAAPATPAGHGGIAILRISGPTALAVGRSLFRAADKSINPWIVPYRRLTLGYAVEPESGEPLDQVLCACFPAPHSYTTEDCVELQCHGGPAVVRALLDAACRLGCRLARPGEFTLRAYLGGRLSLDQAEAVAELVEARSEGEAKLARACLEGGLAIRLAPVRASLVEASAAVEAALDFPEEVGQEELASLAGALAARALAPLAGLVDEARRWRVFRQGAALVICGRPNVGKSSLFNALLGRRRAIVSSRPGTTRDALEETLVLEGVACRLSDTAGLGGSDDELEALGQDAARQRLAEADLCLVVLDGGEPLTPEDLAILEHTAGRARVIAVNKADLGAAWPMEVLGPAAGQALRVSAVAGLNLDLLARSAGRSLCGEAAEPPVGQAVANQRQTGALTTALSAAQRAVEELTADNPRVELASVDLAVALAHLGEVDGLDAPDQVIDAIFSRFCVGK